MNNALTNIFSINTESLSLVDVMLNFLATLVLSIMVYESYSMSHSGSAYNAKFNKYLAMLALITALVINVVGNGIGISLAALGIFLLLCVRETENDTGNSAYILWSLAIGICCGVKQYTIAVIGSSVIFVFAAVLDNVRGNESYVLVIRGSLESMQAIENTVAYINFDRLKLKTKNINGNGVEYLFELSENIMNNDKSIRLEKMLSNTEGVSDIMFFRQGEQYAKE